MDTLANTATSEEGRKRTQTEWRALWNSAGGRFPEMGLCDSDRTMYTFGKYPQQQEWGTAGGGVSTEERLHNKIMMVIMRNSRHTNDQAEEEGE